MGTPRGQSETFDTVALIAVVVTLSLVVGGLGLGTLDTDAPPLLSADLDRAGGSLSLAHTGGDAIQAGTLTVVARNATDEVRFGLETATVSGDGDDTFELGESATHSLGLDGATLRILVVHGPTNTVLIDRSVEEPPPSGDVAIAGNQPPTAGFTYSPSPPNVAEEMTFDAAPSSDDGAITGYEWDVDDDGVYEQTGEVITHTYDSLGDRTVTLRVTDDNGATDTTTVSFSLTKAEPVASFTYTPPTPGTGQEISFDASGSTDVDGTITSYEWDWTSDGTYEATGETASHSYGGPGEEDVDIIGTYTVTLRVTDDDGLTDTTTALVTVNGNDAPTPSFTFSPAAPVPAEPIEFDASGSSDPDGLIATYEWDWTSDGTYEATGETATHDFDSPGTYNVTLRVTDGLGGYNTTTRSVEVEFTDNNEPTARFNATADDWYSSAWDRRKRIELDHRRVDGQLTDFPVLIELTDDDLKDHARSDADDVLFTAGDGTTKLDHEVESYSFNDGHLVAWVAVPQLNATAPNTTVYLYYDADDVEDQEDATGVWDGHAGVWHLEAGGVTTTRPDATANGNDATPEAFDGDEDDTGVVLDGDEFDGFDDRLRVSEDPSLAVDDTDRVTVSMWVRKDAPQSDYIVAAGRGTAYSLGFVNGNEPAFAVSDSSLEIASSDSSVATGDWHHLVGTFDGSTVRIYVDGSERGTATASYVADAGGVDFGIGAFLEDGANYHLDGGLDEVRVSSTARSADWVATEYNNTADPAGFVSVGAEQTAYPVTVDASGSTDDDGSLASFEWDWTADGTYDDTGESAIHSYSGPDTYTIRLRVTDSTGAANTTTEDVTVSVGNADPVVDIAVSPTDPVEEEIVRFDASGTTDPEGPITTYEWDFTDDGTWDATGETVTHEFDDDGTQTVALRVTDSAGVRHTATTTVTVSPTTFSEETDDADLGDSPGGGALVLADFDEDGLLDVFMSDSEYDSDAVRLRENDGEFEFQYRDDQVSVNGGRGAGAGDVDNDGDTDLLVGVGQELNENTGDFSFAGSTVGSANNEEALMFVDIDGDGDLDVWSPGEDYLWHENTDDGWDSHATIPGDGVDRTANGEGASAADIDDDGDVDLIWAQSASDVDVFENQGDGTYGHEWDVDGTYGLPEDVGNHENMEWAWGDYDDDGDLDVYISGPDNEGLYRNDGTGDFTEVTSSAGIEESAPDGAAWGDYNNDGHLDLLLADADGNGDIYDNDGDGTFTEVDASAELDGDQDLGSTIGWFDADNDGDLDIVSNEPVRLWNNTQDDEEFLRVMVRGNGTADGSPTTPIGAQVDLYDDTGTLVGHRALIASQNQLQPPLRQHFGVRPNASYDVRVRFPSGAVVWRNDTMPSRQAVAVGSTTLEQTVLIREPASGWPQKQYDARNLGTAPGGAPRADLVTKWTYTAPDDGFDAAGPVVSADTVYVGESDRQSPAFHAIWTNGTQRWTYTDLDDEVKATPALAEDTVFFGSRDGNLYALDADDGSLRWLLETEGEFDKGSPTVADGVVYIGETSGRVYAVYAATGDEVWQADIGEEVKAAPAVANGSVYAAEKKSGTVYALAAADGTEEWTFSVGGEVELSAPTVADGTVFVGDKKDGELYAIDAADGTEQWSVDLGQEVKSSPAVVDGTVYVGAKKDGILYALDAADGSEEWRYSAGGELEDAAPAVVNGSVYLGDKAGTVSVIDADTGSAVWSGTVGTEVKAPLAVTDEAIYVADNGDETVTALGRPTVFADDFDRANSNTVGNGWTGWEAESDEARLQDDRLDFEPDNRAERPVIQHDFSGQSSGTIRLTFTFNFERTADEQYYSANIQLGDGDAMVDPASDHDTGVAVNLKWGGNDTISEMTDEEGFGYTDDGTDTQIGVVSGDAGENAGGDATVNVTVDLDANTYDINVTGDGLVSGSGTATDVPFENDVDVDAVRIFLDEVAQGNFDDLEIDDVEVRRVV